MNLGDIESVYAIEQAAYTTPWSENIIRDCVLVGYDCQVLELKKAGVPFVCGYIISRLDNQSYHILNLAIAKSLQSFGWGRKLLEYVLNSLTIYSLLHDVFLEVRPSNTIAIHLYKSLGFEQVDMIKAYYVDAEGREDALVLRKKLKH